ncbi:MAG: non-ribosomal peptide synthetase, partial [Candidatus Aminicenantes bacterium]|nr:non-ribosomal peptide synthetase [Candidatus Aminicenantes bacterium]
FFELGGHSLRGTTMLSKVHREFNVQIPVAKIFQISTIRGLADYIDKASENRYTSLEPTDKKEYYPATSIQERLFVLHEIEGIGTAYNIRSVFRVEGPLDIRRLEQVFKTLIHRHESLRTSFAIKDDRLVQVVHNSVDFEIEHFEAGNRQEADGIIDRFIRPFDLSKAPLLRVGVITTADESHILIRDIHHSVSDGTSQVILFREFLRLYEGKELPELKIQYKDYARWQNTPRRQAILKVQEEYWLRLFKDGIPVLENFTDYPRPAVQDFSGDLIRMGFSEELTGKINSLALSSGVTLYMALLAVYNILLFKYTGCRDILVGTPLAGRNHPDVENVAGLFINALVMRNYPANHKTAARFLDEVKQNTTAAYENQDYPFGDLLDKLGVKNDISRNPVYDVELIVQNMDFPAVETKELVLKPHPNDVNVSQVDAALYVHESGGKLYFRFIYSTALFKRSTMERFLTHFKEIASQIVDNREIKLQDIKISHDLQRIKPGIYSEMAADLEF